MNIVEFARKSGFSTATVSRAFHEPHKVNEQTREAILGLARNLRYYPDPSGRALVQGRHDVLGLVWPLEVEGSGARFAQRVLASLTRELVRNDLDLLISPVDRSQPGTMSHARRTLLRSRCDAWILLYPRRDDELIQSLRNSRKPVICLMGRIASCPEWKWVRLNQRSWIKEALRRLRKAGARKVLFLGGRPGEPDHEERVAAFGALAPEFFGSRVQRVAGWPVDAARLRELLAQGKADGIIAVDDSAALVAIEQCRRLGLGVPEAVRIVGIDDIPEAETACPPLSTFRQPLDEMVAWAVKIALGRAGRSRLFDSVFVPRASLPAG
jgi:DNA-binding LacI/PurR family transcriptional regulator